MPRLTEQPPVLEKTCKDCLETLPAECFTPHAECKGGLLPRCKQCMRLSSAAYRAKRPEIHRTAVRKWTAANREKARECVRANYRKNKEAILARHSKWSAGNPDRMSSYQRNYVERNRERIRARQLSFHHANKNRPDRLIRRRVRSRLSSYLSGRRAGYMREIGCDVEAFRRHMELLFPEGMGWHNTSEWVIDHFYPLAAIGKNPDWLSAAAVCNYRNLRPVWKRANAVKRAAVIQDAVVLFEAIKELIMVGKA